MPIILESVRDWPIFMLTLKWSTMWHSMTLKGGTQCSVFLADLCTYVRTLVQFDQQNSYQIRHANPHMRHFFRGQPLTCRKEAHSHFSWDHLITVRPRATKFEHCSDSSMRKTFLRSNLHPRLNGLDHCTEIYEISNVRAWASIQD